MINLHIRKDFQTWVAPHPSDDRITALCGVKTSEKFASVPVAISQPAFVTDSGDGGWCVHCCGAALEICNDVVDANNDHRNNMPAAVLSIYIDAMLLMMKQIVQTNKYHNPE